VHYYYKEHLPCCFRLFQGIIGCIYFKLKILHPHSSIAKIVMLIVFIGSASAVYSNSDSSTKQNVLQLQGNAMHELLAKSLYITLHNHNGKTLSELDFFIAGQRRGQNVWLQLGISPAAFMEQGAAGYRYLWRGRNASKDWFMGFYGTFNWQPPWNSGKRYANYSLRSWMIAGEFATRYLQLQFDRQQAQNDSFYMLSISAYLWHKMNQWGRVNPYVFGVSNHPEKLQLQNAGLGARWELPAYCILQFGLIWDLALSDWLLHPQPSLCLQINLTDKNVTTTYAKHRVLKMPE
jgi:hypothetical protein